MANKFDRFSKQARQVLTHAQEEAQLLNHNYIGTEHLLLGLVREPTGIPAKVLHEQGVDLQKTRAIVTELIGKGQRSTFGRVSLTPRTKRAIELAVDEARQIGHHYIGPEHLLLGLLRQGDGIAIDVLQKMSVDLPALRAQLIQQIQQMPQQIPGEPQADSHTEIEKLIELVQNSKDLSVDKKQAAIEALQFIAEELAEPPRNKLILKGTLQAVQWVVADAADIAAPALSSIAILLQSLG